VGELELRTPALARRCKCPETAHGELLSKPLGAPPASGTGAVGGGAGSLRRRGEHPQGGRSPDRPGADRHRQIGRLAGLQSTG
jgi:hypothetical protein